MHFNVLQIERRRLMFNANFMLAKAIQKDQLRMARRERLGRQMIEIARKALFAKREKKENR